MTSRPRGRHLRQPPSHSSRCALETGEPGLAQAGVGQLRLAMGIIETRAGNLAAARPLLESSILHRPVGRGARHGWLRSSRQAGKTGRCHRATFARRSPPVEAKQHPLSAGRSSTSTSSRSRRTSARPTRPRPHSLRRSEQRSTHASAPNNPVEKGPLREAPRARALPLLGCGGAAEGNRARLPSRRAKTSTSSRPPCSKPPASVPAKRRGRRACRGRPRSVSAELDERRSPSDAALRPALHRERNATARTDGTATRALASIRDLRTAVWPSRSAPAGLGKSKDADLVAAAPIDRTEDRGRVLQTARSQKDCRRRKRRRSGSRRRAAKSSGHSSWSKCSRPASSVGAARSAERTWCPPVCRFLLAPRH